MTDMENLSSDTTASSQPYSHDQFQLLMSMSLDGMLEPEQKEKLHTHLSGCRPCNVQWMLWNKLHQQFSEEPAVLPPADLSARVQNRLQVAERSSHARVGLMLAVLTFLVWMIGFGGAALLIGLLVYNQVGWFGHAVDWMSSTWTLTQVMGSSLWQVAQGIGGNPSTLLLCFGYSALTLAVLFAWTRFLQRSTQPLDTGQMQY